MSNRHLNLNTKFVANTVLYMAKKHNFKLNLKMLTRIMIEAEKHIASDLSVSVFNEQWSEIEANGEKFAGYVSISSEGWREGVITNYAPVSTGEIYMIPYGNEFYPYLAFSFYKFYGKYSQPI